jgi:hypothetical protein
MKDELGKMEKVFREPERRSILPCDNPHISTTDKHFSDLPSATHLTIIIIRFQIRFPAIMTAAAS